MKRRVSILLLLFLLLALSVCGAACTSTAPPEVVDTWTPPPGAEGFVRLSCNEIGEVFAYDPQAPLDTQETSRRRESDVTVIELTYASPMGGRVPATLVVPDGAGPFAGMLFEHGMPSTRLPYISNAIGYAQRGAVVLLIDAPFARRPDGLTRAMTFTEQDRREQIQFIVDLRRGVDLLLSRPEVDPERLAYLGHSYAGRMGGLLAGVEHRVQAYVLLSGGGGMVSYVTDPTHDTTWDYMSDNSKQNWVVWMWPIEPIHYVGCASPAALLFMNGTLDTSSTVPDALRYQAAGSEPKTVLWYPDGHQLNEAAMRAMRRWLSQRIGISAGPPFPRAVHVLLSAWAVLVVVSLGVLGWDTWRRRPAPRGARWMWILTTLFLGPLGLLIYWVSGRRSAEAAGASWERPAAWRALGSAAWAAAGNMPGGIGVLALAMYVPLLGDLFDRYIVLQVALTFLLPFSAGALTFALTRWLSRSDMGFGAAHSRPMFVEAVSTCLVLAAAFPTFIILNTRYLSVWALPFGFDLTYPPLWGAFCLAVLAGTTLTYPFHLWMTRRGMFRWGIVAISKASSRELAWYVRVVFVVLSLVIMIGAIFVAMQIAQG